MRVLGGQRSADDGWLTAATIIPLTPTLAELFRALITDQPLSPDPKREVAAHVLRLTRRMREAQGSSDNRHGDSRDNCCKEFQTTALVLQMDGRLVDATMGVRS